MKKKWNWNPCDLDFSALFLLYVCVHNNITSRRLTWECSLCNAVKMCVSRMNEQSLFEVFFVLFSMEFGYGTREELKKLEKSLCENFFLFSLPPRRFRMRNFSLIFNWIRMRARLEGWACERETLKYYINSLGSRRQWHCWSSESWRRIGYNAAAVRQPQAEKEWKKMDEIVNGRKIFEQCEHLSFSIVFFLLFFTLSLLLPFPFLTPKIHFHSTVPTHFFSRCCLLVDFNIIISALVSLCSKNYARICWIFHGLEQLRMFKKKLSSASTWLKCDYRCWEFLTVTFFFFCSQQQRREMGVSTPLFFSVFPGKFTFFTRFKLVSLLCSSARARARSLSWVSRSQSLYWGSLAWLLLGKKNYWLAGLLLAKLSSSSSTYNVHSWEVELETIINFPTRFECELALFPFHVIENDFSVSAEHTTAHTEEPSCVDTEGERVATITMVKASASHHHPASFLLAILSCHHYRSRLSAATKTAKEGAKHEER